MTLEQPRVLLKVLQSSSFTRAAESSGTQKGRVSGAVAQPEARLGAKLPERPTRTLSVTETGREVFERAVGIAAAVDDTVRLVPNVQGEPRGALRLKRLRCGARMRWCADHAWGTWAPCSETSAPAPCCGRRSAHRSAWRAPSSAASAGRSLPCAPLLGPLNGRVVIAGKGLDPGLVLSGAAAQHLLVDALHPPRSGGRSRRPARVASER
jgi:hypothetical protein